MAHDVFISYSSQDKPIADAVVAALEGRGIRCWIAPRDILAGTNWGAAIVNAISESRAMVLVYSGSANASSQIPREVERAADRHLPIVPFRIEDVPPSAELAYFLSTPHWLDAVGPKLKPGVQRLVEVVSQVVAASATAPPTSAPPAAPGPAGRPAGPVSERPASASRRRAALAVGVGLVVAAGAAFIAYRLGPGSQPDGARKDSAEAGARVPATGPAAVDQTDAAAVAAALLRAWKSGDESVLLAYSSPRSRKDVAKAGRSKGQKGKRHATKGLLAAAWDGRIRGVRYQPPARADGRWLAHVAFADPGAGRVPVVSLAWAGGKWWFVESGPMPAPLYDRLLRDLPSEIQSESSR